MLVVTRMLSARIGDRYGRSAVIVPGLSLALVAQLVFAFAWGGEALYLGVSLYAMGIGLAQPGLGAFVIDRLTPERRGIGMAPSPKVWTSGWGWVGSSWVVSRPMPDSPQCICVAAAVWLLLWLFLCGAHGRQKPRPKGIRANFPSVAATNRVLNSIPSVRSRVDSDSSDSSAASPLRSV